MKVIYDSAGNFVFLFDKSERELGIELLLSIEADSDEAYRIIDETILALKYAGEPIPDNVTRIY